MRSRLSPVVPDRSPLSHSACRTQPRSVSPVQPISAAIELIAAHYVACSPCCWRTRRTARSRTSGENRRYLQSVIGRASQELRPPTKPGRFNLFRLWLAVPGGRPLCAALQDAYKGVEPGIVRMVRGGFKGRQVTPELLAYQARAAASLGMRDIPY